jgi:hypothetical protein
VFQKIAKVNGKLDVFEEFEYGKLKDSYLLDS